MDSGKPAPALSGDAILISIIVPNYNGEEFIEGCLKSILEQDYPHVEVIVIDGGSSDGSVEIIQQYADRLAYWVSEPDRGQAHAINKGFLRATGSVVNWLCSDDRLEPGALSKVGEAFLAHGDVDVVVGACRWISTAHGTTMVRSISPQEVALTLWNVYINQPSCFYRRRLLSRTPPLQEDLNYAMDVELWAFFQKQGAKWQCLEDVLSTYIWHGSNKTVTGGHKIIAELDQVYHAYVGDSLPALIRSIYLPVQSWLDRLHSRVKRLFVKIIKRFILYSLMLRYGRRRTKCKIEQYEFFIASVK